MMAMSSVNLPVSIQVYDLDEDFFKTFKLNPGRILGRGMAGEVVVATAQSNSSVKRAVKKLSLLTEDEKDSNQRLFSREICSLQGLEHPNIIKHFASARCPEYLAICIEYCPQGTLTHRIPQLSRNYLSMYFAQMACGVRFLHKMRTVHCDIKPCNIFLRNKNHVVLGDFGLSFQVPEAKETVSAAGVGGTPPFMAPEIWTSDRVDPFKLDIYSLGATLWSMVLKKTIKDDDKYNYLQLIKDPKGYKVSSPYKWCLFSMLETNPDKRTDITCLLEKLCGLNFMVSLIDNL